MKLREMASVIILGFLAFSWFMIAISENHVEEKPAASQEISETVG